jgi:predicted membrane protein
LIRTPGVWRVGLVVMHLLYWAAAKYAIPGAFVQGIRRAFIKYDNTNAAASVMEPIGTSGVSAVQLLKEVFDSFVWADEDLWTIVK